MTIPSSLLCVAIATASIACTEVHTYRWGDERVLCATSIDDHQDPDLGSIAAAIEIARDEQSVVMLYGHTPGEGLALGTIEALLEMAAAANVPLISYRDMLPGQPRRAGIALSFDDSRIDAWYSIVPLLERYDASITVFVSRFHAATETDIAQLEHMAALGHAVEYHGTNHVKARDYVDDHGLDAYMEDEFFPDLALMRGAGFDPVAFAYPHGSRSDELDVAILREMHFVRGTQRCSPRSTVLERYE
jgi:peptidoglycan/xylan/chitin deacetylase (PgdA/CDA1 family)